MQSKLTRDLDTWDEEREKLKNKITDKDDELVNIQNNHRTETNNLNIQIKELQNQIQQLQSQRQELQDVVNEKQKVIDDLTPQKERELPEGTRAENFELLLSDEPKEYENQSTLNHFRNQNIEHISSNIIPNKTLLKKFSESKTKVFETEKWLSEILDKSYDDPIHHPEIKFAFELIKQLLLKTPYTPTSLNANGRQYSEKHTKSELYTLRKKGLVMEDELGNYNLTDFARAKLSSIIED